MRRTVYLTNSATTKPYQKPLRLMQVATRIWGSPSSLQSKSGDSYLELLGNKLPRLIESQWEIYFVWWDRRRQLDHKGVAARKLLWRAYHCLWHRASAVRISCLVKDAGIRSGCTLQWMRGSVKVDALASLLRPDTTLVSVMAVNNEVGSIQPIMTSLLFWKIAQLLVSMSCGSSFGKGPATEVYLPDAWTLRPSLVTNFMAFASWICLHQKKAKDHSSLNGGGQEKEMRSTTENVAGIAATASSTLIHGKPEKALPVGQQMKEVIRKRIGPTIQMSHVFSGEITLRRILTFGIREFVEK